MKFKYFIGVVSLLLAVVFSAQADQLDFPVDIPVAFYGTGAALYTGGTSGQSSFSFGSDLGDSSGTGATITQTYTGQQFDSSVAVAYLSPGKSYTVTVTSNSCVAVLAKFLPINGCRIFLNGVENHTVGSGSSFTFTVMIKPAGSGNGVFKVNPLDNSPPIMEQATAWKNDLVSTLAGLRGGESTTFPENRAMWFVGLGTMRNGESAGALGFMNLAITSVMGKTSALIYDSPDPTEVSVTRTGGYITQILSRDVKVVVDPYNGSSTSYFIKVYKNVSPAPPAPFVTYKVSYYVITGGGRLRVDRLEDNVQWTMQLDQTATTWKRYAWQQTHTGTSIDSTKAIDLSGPSASTVISGTYPATTETVTYGGCDDENGAVVLQKTKTYVSAYGGHQELASVQSGSGSSAPVARYTYYTTSTGGGWAAALATVVEPTGNWTKYEYYNTAGSTDAGQIKTIYRPWKDAPSAPSGASATAGYVESYTYTTNYDGSKTAPATRTIRINNVQTGSTSWSYYWNYASPNGQTVSQQTRYDYASSSTTDYTATSTTAYLPTCSDSFLAGRPHSVTYTDGRRDSYAYIRGTWDPSANKFTGDGTGGDREILVIHGQSTTAFGGTACTSWKVDSVTWTIDGLNLFNKASTVSVTVVNKLGQVVYTGTNVYDGNNLYDSTHPEQRIAAAVTVYDDNNRRSMVKDLVRSVTAGDVKTSYAYNASLMTSFTDSDGVPTTWSYNNYLQNTTIVSGASGQTADGFPQKTQTFSYYPCGLKKLAQECSCSPAGTAYYYQDSGRLRKKTDPMPSTTAGQVLATTYDYSTDNLTTTEKNPSEATTVTTLFLDGRVKSLSGDTQVTRTYDYVISSGREVRTTTTNGTANTTGWLEETFDWLGRVVIMRSPQVGWNSGTNADKVTRTERNYNSAGQLASVDVWNEFPNPEAKLLPTHFYTWGKLGLLTQEADDIDDSGGIVSASTDRIINYGFTYVLETTGNLGWLQKETVAILRTDGNSTDSTTISTRNTRLTKFDTASDSMCISEVRVTDASSRTLVDRGWVFPAATIRKVVHSESSLGSKGYQVTTNGYLSNVTTITGVSTNYTYNTVGLLDKTTDAKTGAYTQYTYYDDTKYPHVITHSTGASSTAADTFEYGWSINSKSLKVRTYDKDHNLSSNEYDAKGRLWRTWGTGVQPVVRGYDAYGRMKSLTTWTSNSGWNVTTFPSSPGAGNVTNWTVDPATGAVLTKTYADGKTVNYTYNPRGQVATRKGSRNLLTTYNYYDGGTSVPLSGALKSVVYTASGGISTPTVSFTYTRFGAINTVADATGTRTIAYRTDLKPDSETEGTLYGGRVLDFSYDSIGRPTGYTFNAVGAIPITETVTYEPGPGRVASLTGAWATATPKTATFTVTYQNGSDCLETLTSGKFVRQMTLETNYNAYKAVQTKWDGTDLGTFTATYTENRGLQNSLTSGSAQAGSWSQVLGLGAGITQNFGYDAERQQTSAATPTYVGAPGTETLSTRNYGWTYDNQGNRLTQTGASALSYTPDGATNQYDAVTDETGLTYDNDGNLSKDGTWTNYTYDHENRLTSMSKTGQTITFIYDYLGRRVRKTVTGTDASDTKFLWTGQTLIADLMNNGVTPTRSYIWGQDLSDIRGNAGGAGALLAQIDSGGVKYAMADQHGNVVGYLNSSGTIVAAREFGAFGQILDSAGSPDDYSMWYASKYRDKETDLHYYGFRYYQSKHGRFINRDPIEEAGGNNLYAFCQNMGLNGWDIFGLDGEDDEAVMLDPFEVTADADQQDPGNAHFTPGASGNPYKQDLPNFNIVQTHDLGMLSYASGGSSSSARKNVSIDLLRKLCGTSAGRALVASMAKEDREVREVDSGLLDAGMQASTANTAGTSDEVAGVIYIFSDNFSRLTTMLANSQFQYGGTVVEFAASTIVHETRHFNNPRPPGPIPIGQSGRYEEALVRQITDQALPTYNLPQIFGLGSFQDYLGTVPRQGTDLRTGKTTGDYGQKADQSVMSKLKKASSSLGGWDCSRKY